MAIKNFIFYDLKFKIESSGNCMNWNSELNENEFRINVNGIEEKWVR